MDRYATEVKAKLLDLVTEMEKQAMLFSKRPGKDFSRTRKLGLAETIKILLSLGEKSMNGELIDYFACAWDMPTASALAQQRQKLLPETIPFLLHEFTSLFPGKKLFEGYRLLAADGSDVGLPHNPCDQDNHFRNPTAQRGFNMLHLDCLYDLCNHTYIDVAHETYSARSERQALVKMIDRSHIAEKVILTADRGYEGYNTLAHLQEKGWHYVIRVKDVHSNGMLSGLELPDSMVFDTTISIVLTRKQTNFVKANRQLYKTIEKASPFDYLDLHHNIYYPISFRVLRFPIAEDAFECVVTNLPEDLFPFDSIKRIYALRWGIETAFRDLKHTIGLKMFHAKKIDFIVQEIYARFIMYNFCQLITSNVALRKKDCKYKYQINFSAAVSVCRFFFRHFNNSSPPDIQSLLSRFILPIRNDRSFPRRSASFSSGFFYRIA